MITLFPQNHRHLRAEQNAHGIARLCGRGCDAHVPLGSHNQPTIPSCIVHLKLGLILEEADGCALGNRDTAAADGGPVGESASRVSREHFIKCLCPRAAAADVGRAVRASEGCPISPQGRVVKQGERDVRGERRWGGCRVEWIRRQPGRIAIPARRVDGLSCRRRHAGERPC